MKLTCNLFHPLTLSLLWPRLNLCRLIRLGTASSDLCRATFFDTCSYNIGGDIYSLSDLEHGLLRGNRRGPYKLLPQLSGGIGASIYGAKSSDAYDRRTRAIVRYARFWRSPSLRCTVTSEAPASAPASAAVAAATTATGCDRSSAPAPVGPEMLSLHITEPGCAQRNCSDDSQEHLAEVALAGVDDITSSGGAEGKPIHSGGGSKDSLVCSKAVDNRIHFALNCGARSCPPVRFYSAETLDEDLDLAARAFCEDDSNFLLEDDGTKLCLSRIFYWYWKDFTAPGLGRPLSTSANDEADIGRALLPFMSVKKGAALSK